jgi:hypothetical protein
MRTKKMRQRDDTVEKWNRHKLRNRSHVVVAITIDVYGGWEVAAQTI